MAQNRQKLVSALQTLRLYRPVHYLWSHRLNLRLKLWNTGYRIAGSIDHLPIPPAHMIQEVVNTEEISWFLSSGRISFEGIRYTLQKSGFSPENFHSVLDFGCGCGRVIRYWYGIRGPRLYGTDYNPELIEWDQHKLRMIGKFSINQLAPPLSYLDASFDLVYALSVFTHFTAKLQKEWMDELYRVLRPGGLLLITLHGRSRLDQLNEAQRERFRSGEMVVIFEERVGENICGAYHPETYVRMNLAERFEVIDIIENGARDSSQDIYLLRRPVLPS